MKFYAINPWTEYSECRCYSIAMSTRWRDGKPFWTAWKCDEDVPKPLLTSPSHLDCVIACSLSAQGITREQVIQRLWPREAAAA